MPQHFKFSHASFAGKNNLTKAWVLVALLDHRDHEDNSGLDAVKLAVLTGRPVPCQILGQVAVYYPSCRHQ